MRVLVVEDDTKVSSFIQKGPEAGHYAVDVAYDGEIAASHISSVDYAAIVLDLSIPKVHRLEVLRRLREKSGRLTEAVDLS